MLKAIKKRFQKELNQFHDFFFGIEPKPKPKPKPKPDIAVGDIFILGQGKEEKDPFKRAKQKNIPIEVKILAIQDGYVQYEIIGLKYMNYPDSKKMDMFLYCYKKKSMPMTS